jgi:hypothetical protein
LFNENGLRRGADVARLRRRRGACVTRIAVSLRSVALRGIALGGVPLRRVPLRRITIALISGRSVALLGVAIGCGVGGLWIDRLGDRVGGARKGRHAEG